MRFINRIRNHFFKPNILLCLFLFSAVFFVTGCTVNPAVETNAIDKNAASISIGRYLSIDRPNDNLVLYDNNEALAADGLYYATWTIGTPQPYENSDGESVDLYDAQLYLLLSESKNEEEALNFKNTWLENGKTNYEILKEETIICNNQSFTKITYNFKNAENPYARGVSAFGTFNNNAICVELTCRDNFDQDLEMILTNFLNGCHYK